MLKLSKNSPPKKSSKKATVHAIIIDNDRTDQLHIKRLIKSSKISGQLSTFVSEKQALRYMLNGAREKIEGEGEHEYVVFINHGSDKIDGMRFIQDFEKNHKELSGHFKFYLLTQGTNPVDLMRASCYQRLFGFIQMPMTRRILEVLQLSTPRWAV